MGTCRGQAMAETVPPGQDGPPARPPGFQLSAYRGTPKPSGSRLGAR